MKKLAYFSLCLLPLIFVSCATLDAISSVSKMIDSVSAGESDSKESSEKTDDIARYAQIANSVTTALEQINPQDRYVIGRAVASSICGKYKLYENKAATEYLNKILAAIVRNSDDPFLYKGYFIGILNTDEVNAISTPGGHIFITRGLMQQAKSEDELAAVIAHEVAHIQLGHAIESIKSTRLLDATSKILTEIDYQSGKYSDKQVSEFNDTRNMIFSNVVESGFSKTQEFAADEKALTLMADAGYNPDCMLNLLETLKSNTSGSGWSKTHPKPDARIEKSQKKLKSIKFTGALKTVRQKRFDSAKVNF